MDWTWYLFGFKGRINRAKYWLAGLVLIGWMALVAALVIGLVAVLGATAIKSLRFNIYDVFAIIDPESYRGLSAADILPLCIKALALPLFLWVYLATSIKRLHDRDRNGWWVLPFFVVPGIVNQFADRLPSVYLTIPLGLIAGILCIWGGIEMFFLKGSRKTNRFGPNPLLPPQADTSPLRDSEPRWDQQSEIEMTPHKAGPPPVWRVKPGA